MAKKQHSTSNENQGVSATETANPDAIKSFKQKQKVKISTSTLIDGILSKNITALSKAITLVESRNPNHAEQAQTIIQECLPHAGQSIRIGITGVPGVGKSTFIETLGQHLIKTGKRVAVLAIDPSSSVTKGSILGDKTRMENLAKSDNAFIRPSATGDSLGGVARTTRETIVLCEAAGFDVIIIETVGVGQSETTVHGMVDFFLLLKLAGAGDELQGIKRGIIEMADAIAINKADGDNLKPAKLAKTEFRRALNLYPEKDTHWQPQVLLCSAINNEGIDAIWKVILEYVEVTTQNGYFSKKRNKQSEHWLLQTIENQLKSRFFQRTHIKAELDKQLKLISENKTTAFAAADYLLSLR